MKNLIEYVFPYFFKGNNEIVIIEKGKEKKINIFSKKIKGLTLDISGSKNRIVLEKPYNFVKTTIKIAGKFNSVHIASSNLAYKSLNILFSGSWSNRSVNIGKNCSFFGPVQITITDSDSQINIGEETIISHDVSIYSSDNHLAFDKISGEIVNKGNYVTIGNHCWIGHKVAILKNVQLCDNIIVGAGSVVTKSFDEEEDIVIAGNPAKIVKRNTVWLRKGYDSYSRDLKKQLKGN